MANFKRGYRKPKREVGSGAPKHLQKPNQRENLHHRKSKNKVCKATKGTHDYKVDIFKIKSYGKFTTRIFPQGFTYFRLRITYRCPCGKKGGWNKGVWNF